MYQNWIFWRDKKPEMVVRGVWIVLNIFLIFEMVKKEKRFFYLITFLAIGLQLT